MPISTEKKLEYLQGSVERVTFFSEETGFCVLRTKVKNQRDLVTVIGNAAAITAGEYIQCQGVWINDKQHGIQFKTTELKTVQPTTLEGIEKYLGSGMVKGVGPYLAKKLVKAFGVAVFEIIESEPHRLTELDGIAEKRKKMILSAWSEQKAIRDIVIFLHAHGVGTAKAVRIYKTYGNAAIAKVKENPYCLALDIHGIGFKSADQLAQKLGIAKNALIRAQAGIRHVLHELCDHGHCAVELAHLKNASVKLLEIPIEIIEEAVAIEIAEKNVVEEKIGENICIYPVALYRAEKKSAELIKKLNQGMPPWGEIEAKKVLPWVEEKTKLNLSDSQKKAIEQVLLAKVSIITGGPGVGKTTLVNSLLKILLAKKMLIALCAPTGRAAKRLQETTGITAKTIHRLLEYDPKTHQFKHNQDYLIPAEVFVIDESSMIDIVLLSHLLKAIPKEAAVIFVGDIDQLPSVGAGAVLSDLIRSQKIVTVRLTEIFRQAESSKIIVNAHRINQGQMPLPNKDKKNDFFTMYVESPEILHETIIDLVGTRLPQFYHCNAIRDIQVLVPMNKGGLGSRSLNIELQKKLNGQAEPKIMRYGSTFSPGDKVIQLTNNYDKEVFNGDIGYIEKIDLELEQVEIGFDQQIKVYEFGELDELSLAYAISIHKSQGSEFPIVVLPIAMQHYNLLARNLLYTGITRGKRLVVLVGQKKAVAMAIHNNKEAHRLTKLAERL